MAAQARAALMRNLPKKGWTVDGDVGKFKDLTIEFGADNWVMSQSKDGAMTEVATGDYGKTQMADVKKAASAAGSPFAPVSGGGAAAGGEGKPARQMSEETRQKMREKRQAAAAARKAAKDDTGAETTPPESSGSAEGSDESAQPAEEGSGAEAEEAD